MGLRVAGYYVVGVDVEPQPRYVGNIFIQADALELPLSFLRKFDLIWASPPCQRWTRISDLNGNAHTHPDLIEPTRELLTASGRAYIIENVPGAPLLDPIMVCGTSLGLRSNGFEVRRHRLFESNRKLRSLKCDHRSYAAPLASHGGEPNFFYRNGRCYSADEAREILHMPWATWAGMSQAIPPRMAAFVASQV